MKHIKSLLLATALGMSFTSCNDFLNLEPLNDIVLENFWTDKSDVESVLMGAYSALQNNDCLTRMVVWGEMRSDNMVEGSNTNEDARQILRENLLITNGFTKYNAFYTAINRANTVLYFAPQVAEKDPNYLVDELLAHEAEAVAIRCLCYWYLIRAYHDVPYVTTPSIDDEGGHMKFYVPQSPFEEILDSLINDLESVKIRANNKYSTEDANVCRITRSTICAMLADMYLWRGNADDWDKCIAVCEEITDQKLKDWEKLRNKQGKSCTVSSFNGYPLISDAPNDYPGNSYTEIFGDGYSFESLFEFPYNNDVKNTFVFGDQQQRIEPYYQSSQSQSNNSAGQVKAFDNIGSAFGKKDNVFEQLTDVRYYESVVKRGSVYAISKYAYTSMRMSFSDGSLTFYTTPSVRSSGYCNWIVYRYTEALLFEAEAYIMKAKALNPAGDDSIAISNTQKEYKDKAFNLIDAVNQRAVLADNSKSKAVDLATFTSYTTNGMTVSELEELLFKERRRELMFEGKRWFDLVRMARRDGNQERLLRFVEKKYDAATLSAVKIKLKNPYAMYFPLHKDEVRYSQGVLKQNPAYKDEEKNEQASHSSH
ncbi:MAG: RagB/SusD family nutrient uptake outer membrane protein [Bacteroidaceae bacterium]|nr:RagB/SusD family nutrient uptake outer membrane protein [Bacteroidaceae bacterium]